VAIERTFAIIKPDAVGRGLQGEILSRIHKAGFKIVAAKSMRLTKEEAGGFYAVHKARPFFGELTDFMSSGKIFCAGAGSRRRHYQVARHDGRHRSQKKRRRGLFATTWAPTSATTARTGRTRRTPRRFEIGYFFSGLELI